MKDLSRAGSNRYSMVASRDLSFLWGITIIMGNLLFYIVRAEISAKIFPRDKWEVFL